MTDIIDELADIEPGSRLDVLRQQRQEAKTQAQATYDALFSPVSDAAFSLPERWAVAAFVAGISGVAEDHYQGGLAAAAGELAGPVARAVQAGLAEGPYGSFPGELAKESVEGPELALGESLAAELGDRLTAALEHAHLLLLHPRDASRQRLEALVEAGWDADGIVTLSQLVSFLSFQLRVVAGLRVLGEESK